jgi:hypothetical protein
MTLIRLAAVAPGVDPTLLVGIVGAAVTLIGIVATYLATKGRTQTDAKAELDKRIDARVSTELGRVYGRLDEWEDKYTRKMSAVARILRAIADQWPSAHGPNLDPRDIEEIEDTIPVQWIRRPPRADPIEPPTV